MLCKTLGEQLLFQRIVRTWRIWDIKECGISESFSTLISPLPSPGYRTLMLVHPITTHDTGMWRYTLCFLASMTSFSNLNNSSNTDLAMKQWGVWTKNEIFLAYLSGIVAHAYTDIAQINLISPGLCVKEWENISLLCTSYICCIPLQRTVYVFHHYPMQNWICKSLHSNNSPVFRCMEVSRCLVFITTGHKNVKPFTFTDYYLLTT